MSIVSVRFQVVAKIYAVMTRSFFCFSSHDLAFCVMTFFCVWFLIKFESWLGFLGHGEVMTCFFFVVCLFFCVRDKFLPRAVEAGHAVVLTRRGFGGDPTMNSPRRYLSVLMQCETISAVQSEIVRTKADRSGKPNFKSELWASRQILTVSLCWNRSGDQSKWIRWVQMQIETLSI